jgi:uncharacterized protein (DUF488 family)
MSAAELERSLSGSAIEYTHLPELGGRRRPSSGSPNGGWRNSQFQGYADHMASVEFEAGLGRLITLAGARPTAVTCAEAAWWRCHRRLVSDALLVRGWSVDHIGSDGGVTEHELTPFAELGGGRLIYPPVQRALDV